MTRVGRLGTSTVVLAVALGALMGLTSCSSTASQSVGALGADAVITYQFLDSSVPPQYHRSYELRVSPTESRIVVDSYGDVLADETVPTDGAVWAELGDTLDDVSGLRAQPAEEGCTGGTVTSLTVVDADRALVDLMLEECGSANAEEVAAVQTWITPARDQFPPMDQLAPEGP